MVSALVNPAHCAPTLLQVHSRAVREPASLRGFTPTHADLESVR